MSPPPFRFQFQTPPLENSNVTKKRKMCHTFSEPTSISLSVSGSPPLIIQMPQKNEKCVTPLVSLPQFYCQFQFPLYNSNVTKKQKMRHALVSPPPFRFQFQILPLEIRMSQKSENGVSRL